MTWFLTCRYIWNDFAIMDEHADIQKYELCTLETILYTLSNKKNLIRNAVLLFFSYSLEESLVMLLLNG